LVAGLFILKHMHNLSDEALCDRCGPIRSRMTPSRPGYRNTMTQPSIMARSWVPRSGSLRTRYWEYGLLPRQPNSESSVAKPRRA